MIFDRQISLKRSEVHEIICEFILWSELSIYNARKKSIMEKIISMECLSMLYFDQILNCEDNKLIEHKQSDLLIKSKDHINQTPFMMV